MAGRKTFAQGRIFFLGAGFSASAGVPLTNILLPKAARLFQNEAPGLFSRVRNFASDVDVDLDGAPNAEDFARLCTHLDFMELREHGGSERWSKEGSRERLALKYFLSKVIAQSTPNHTMIPSFYKEFARNINTSDLIVTFNWYTLIENCIRSVGLEYSFIGEPGKIQLLKLHGSIDWIYGKPNMMSSTAPKFSYKPTGIDDSVLSDDIYCSQLLQNSSAWAQSAPLVGEVKPLIVLPGYGKAVDVRLLAPLWYRPEFFSIREGKISIIGLSVANDDYIMESLFRYLFRSVFSNNVLIRIVNPDHSVGEKFQRITGRTDIEILSKKFNEENSKLLNL